MNMNSGFTVYFLSREINTQIVEILTVIIGRKGAWVKGVFEQLNKINKDFLIDKSYQYGYGS